MENYGVLLFYKYVTFSEPEKFVEDHIVFCKSNGILGRVWISYEGINATVSGLLENVELYKHEIKRYNEFSDVWFKEDKYSSHAFKKIHVRFKKEIVNSSFGSIDLTKTATKIDPHYLNELYESRKDFLIIDARNEYESRIGKFKNAITPQLKTFRDWPDFVDSLKGLENKTIITYCTGGIRCEKASAYLIEKGFKDVYQINGGIWNYINEYPDKFWEGSMFVFDERRIITPNEKEELKHIGKCHFCGTATSYYINCHNQNCDIILLTCDECKTKNDYCCSESCKRSKNQRPVFHG